MATNLEEMKSINRLALMSELIEKTKNCGLIWSETAPGQYQSQHQNYDFRVNKTGLEVYNLDVLRNGNLYRCYNSSTQEGVKDLFEEINTSLQDNPLEKYKKLSQFLGSIPSCRDTEKNTYNISVLGYGALGAGSAISRQLLPQVVPMEPSTLTFGPTVYPWSGGISNILTNDGDSSYIRQQVAGEFPLNWGYAFVEFDPISVASLEPPYGFQIQTYQRREVNSGVTMKVDFVANSTVVYSSSMVASASYTLYDSGFQVLEDLQEITNLVVRISMFTNSGNLLPRALRVSYVGLIFYGCLPSES